MTHPGIMSSRIRRKLGLVSLISIAIWMIATTAGDDFSVWKALNRHEPSARVFRSIFEMNLILFGTAFGIYVWSRTIGIKMVRELLFQPIGAAAAAAADRAPRLVYNSVFAGRRRGAAENARQRQDDDDGDDEDDIAHDDHADADYDSEGEIPQPRHHHHHHHKHASLPVKTEDHDDDEEDYNNKNDDEDDDDGEGYPTYGVPSAESVLSAALDVLLVLLVTLFFFTMSASGFQTDKRHFQIMSRIAAPIFPLLLFIKLGIMLFVPWKSRRRKFWTVMSYTFGAPMFEVSFRDGFIGDIITSSVRPLQDISFTLVYLLYGLQGWWSQSYFEESSASAAADMNHHLQNATTTTTTATTPSSSFSHSFVDQADANVPVMEKSWLLHTVLLPICAVSPLWWRFLQNLRQVYDSQQRWPYLGNAAKYFVAAQVAMTGVFYPEWKSSPWWLASFVIATVYQIWWDIFMDWGLYEVRITDHCWGYCCSWQLRKRRLYSNSMVYLVITIVNVILRFGWTLTFIPPRYLSATGALKESFTGDLTSVLSPLIASAEIIRRTLWGLLRFEYEALKVGGTDMLKDSEESLPSAAGRMRHEGHHEPDGLELVPMQMQSTGGHSDGLHGEHRFSFSPPMSSMSKTQVLVELCTYAVAFAAIGIVAAVHRGTL